MDPFQQAASEIGSDFAAYMPLTAPVTVAQIDPDAGTVLASAANVPALKRSRRRQPFGVGGGELGSDSARFVFQASAASWTIKARDQVTEASGTVWIVESVELIAFNSLVVCSVTIKR